MSRQTNNPYTAPVRPAFAPLQSTSSSHASSYSSTSSLASHSSTSSGPLNSPNTTRSPQSFVSLDRQTHQQQPQGPQRHPSFEYRPNREGAGQTAAETTNYLDQMALLNEAAKRAQMAVVMRDLDGMEL